MTVTLTPPVSSPSTRAMLIEELARTEKKAEIIKGKVVPMSPAGAAHSQVSTKIVISLGKYKEQFGGGYVCGDNAGFLIELPDRFSFCPDAAWHTGKFPTNDMDFFEGAPVFAVEVRSKNDRGPAAERLILKKIEDYFTAGTQVVWGVDLHSEDVVKKYTPETLDNPHVFKRGEIADAEPAVPGWRMAVNDLF